ncbi:non-ribosomal peptide synthetase [Tenacibaculum agarivorans]|uniref:non-ribosomal peptide synthetase n=1 Tax=Tenacibaculum agarivorans TaxID=1908389 RepID=UPI00094BBA2D|nr:non-ribosomal peptide synthetase [Tenacibaculum agarivorans]
MNNKLEKENVVDILPLSPVQEGILFHYLYSKNSGEYFQQTELSVTGVLDVSVMKQAFKLMVQEHEALRIVFRWENLKKPLQVILKNYEPDLRFIKDQNNSTYIRIEDAKEGINIETAPYRMLFISHSEKLHTFIFSFHHILFDGWSFGVLLKELLQKYHLLLEGNSILPNTVTRGVIKKYLGILQKQPTEKKVAFWRGKLSTYSSSLSLPYMEALKNEGTEKYAQALTEGLMDKIRLCAKEYKVSSASIFYAAWAILLYKASEDAAITFGTTTSGRTDEIPNIEQAIGLFINTLPFHLVIDDNQSIADFLVSVHNYNLNVREYEFTSLQEIKSSLDKETNTALFNSLCVIENYPLSITSHEQGLTVKSSEIHENNNYDITLAVLPFDLEKALHFSYKKQYFTRQSISKIAKHLIGILENITELNKTRTIRSIDLLNEEEKQLLQKFNASDYSFDSIATIHEVLEKRAKTHPNSVALYYQNTTLTYQELDHASSTLAQELKDKGVKEKTVVGVFMERSYELLISIYAIFKAGGVYLPIDPDFPEERVNYILEDSNTNYIVLESKLTSKLPKSFNGNKINVSVETLLQAPYAAFTSFKSLETPAYIIYTSGSTGKPKGVRVYHSSLMNGLFWAQKTYQVSETDVFLLKTPIVFDVSLWELFWGILGGGSLCILPPKKEKEIDVLLEYIENYKITNLFMVPTLLRTFTEYVSSFDLNKRVDSLKRIVASGEALKPNDINSFNNTFKNNAVVISNLYGPTEASVHVSYYDCPKENNVIEVPIGKPIANTKFYVLNSDLQIQPVGMVGELYIGGANVAEKYLNKPTLTSESFIDNPFGFGKLYKTGDLAKWKDNGDLLFFGRKDTQVKVRGYRIELGEIESCLLQHEKINNAKVLLFKDANEVSSLEAFCSGSKDLEEAFLHQFLEERLPSYMIPYRFHILEEIPLTHNGKIDKAKLNTLRIVENNQIHQEEFPVNDNVLRTVLEICKEVLQREIVSPQDNFSQIGGDSIKAIRVLSLLRKEGYEVSIRDILETPILQELSLILKNKIEKRSYEPFIGQIKGNGIQNHFLVTDTNSLNQYNQAIILELTSIIDVAVIEQIVRVLVNQHDVFRTTFKTNNESKEIEMIFSEKEFNYILNHDIVNDSENFETIIKTILDEIHGGLDIEKGPLAIFNYVQSAEKNVLLIVMHHLIIDGVSWRILLEDIQQLFSKFEKKEVLELSINSQSFGHYLQTIHQQVALGAFTSELSYWKKSFSNPKKVFNTKDKTYKHKDFKRKTSLLPKTIVKQIDYINKHAYTNTNEVLVATLGIVMKQLFNIEQLELYLEGHGRTEFGPNIDVSRIVGWFTSLYPVILPKNTNSIIQYLRTVKDALSKVPNNGGGYGILKYLQKETTLKSIPEVSFNHMGDFSSLTKTEYFKVTTDQLGRWYDPERKIAQVLEIFSILESDDELSITIDFIPELFSEDQIETLLQEIVSTIENIELELKGITHELRTPSDFTFREMEMEKLDQVLAEQDKIDDVYELSPTQEGILYHFTNNNDVYSYVVNSSVFLEGEIDRVVLEKAYQSLIQRHDSLRTIFNATLTIDQTLQFVKKSQSVTIPYWEINEIFESYQEFLKDIDEQGREAINTIVGVTPNIRLNLVKLSDKSYRLGFYYHHILLDGWSVAILFNELFKIYQLLLEGKNLENHMQAVPPYKFYIKWLRKQDDKKASHFWSTYLQNFKDPFSFESLLTTNTDKKYKIVESYFDEVDTKTLKTLALQNKGTVYNYLQTVWALLISKISGSNDIVFGQVVSGRPDMKYADRMIGLFINTIPKRVKLQMDMTFRELVEQVADDEIATIPYHYYPLADILTKTSYRDELFSYIMTFENQYQLIENIDSSVKMVKYEGNDPNHYDLSIFFFEEDERLRIELRYNQQKYDRNYLVQIVNDFEALLHETIHNIDKSIEEVLIETTGEMDLPLLV